MKRVLMIAVIAFGAAQIIRPSRTNPPVDPKLEIGSVLALDKAVSAIFDRSCNDCHSHRTVWLWYSNVAPISWLIAHDVNDGREDLNFSQWGSYSAQRREKRLGDICKKVTEGEMPGVPYTLLHPSAKLTQADVQAICRWTESAKRR
jgi:Haem-binding domain